MSKNITILDCTLRDGGYHNNWDFDIPFASRIVSALAASQVDIIEIGYRTCYPKVSDTFHGLFKFCPEEQLGFLPDSGPKFALMLDAKELITPNGVDTDRLVAVMGPASKSRIAWTRLAATVDIIDQTTVLGSVLKDLGYAVSFNLMRVSTVSHAELEAAVARIDPKTLDVLYIADSFGSLVPLEIPALLDSVRKGYPGPIGLHPHDSLGLAFANTLAAIDWGIEYVDSSLLGIGRGAGNLSTEQLLLYRFYHLNDQSRSPHSLFEVLDTELLELKKRYGWGPSTSYMISALLSIHPTYCQALVTADMYSSKEIDSIFSKIDVSERGAYSPKVLKSAIQAVLDEEEDCEGGESAQLKLPEYQPQPHDAVLVIGRGPSADIHASALCDFILQNRPLVLECHAKHPQFAHVAAAYYNVILNRQRLQALLEQTQGESATPAKVITGVACGKPQWLSQLELLHSPFAIDQQNSVGGISLPAYYVGIYAMELARLSAPTCIYLAGFDGYEHPSGDEHAQMNKAMTELAQDTQLVSLTPTRYAVPVRSIYSYL